MTTEMSRPAAVTPAPQLEPELGNLTPCIPRRSVPRHSPHDGRSGRATGDRASHESDSAAQTFADLTFRLIVDVMNRRRPFAHVGPHLDPAIRESVQQRVSARRTVDGAAALRRVRVQSVGPGVAEAFGSFSRNNRVHAIAARITQDTDGRWLLSALALP